MLSALPSRLFDIESVEIAYVKRNDGVICLVGDILEPFDDIISVSNTNA